MDSKIEILCPTHIPGNANQALLHKTTQRFIDMSSIVIVQSVSFITKDIANHKGGGLVVKAWSPKGENTWSSQGQPLGAAKFSLVAMEVHLR